ncbi:hypothetical protein GIB67_031909 [Kingdonia uniflora]|uniref:BRCT domain-containing protein n=1 Tax=Kingdonia uniflora TaxID=39325 RepID=A0A7J7NTK1_9MAGN|nr:hypothetical protein GIB67_031909 [Kingdonia uniflora]
MNLRCQDKFEYFKAKGCNLIGPQCVLSCAKENRGLPKQQGGFTCCLAMEGVKVLASGFDKEEKVKIEELVTAMGGVIKNSASMDVSFVIVKNVLAVKYKWASTILKKPIVTISWLYQCWNEHRVVPHEPYRVLPFSGLTICATGIPIDLRMEMEKLILQNGGEYSADLTRKYSDLMCFNCNKICVLDVSYAPKGDKYVVAQKWGHIYTVTRKWLDQSISRRACVDEKSYPVQGSSLSSRKSVKIAPKEQLSEVKESTSSQSLPFSVIPDVETALSENISYPPSNSTTIGKEDGSEALTGQTGDESKFDGCVADDSQNEDNDLYLSECRILLVGFQAAAEMRKLVNMVRNGGGSRYMSFGQKLTHIVVGTPSENEKKEVRQQASFGVIHVVRTTWLEECNQEKKEVPVSQRHVYSDFVLSKDPVSCNKATVVGLPGINQKQSSLIAPTSISINQGIPDITIETGTLLEKRRGKVTQYDECKGQRNHPHSEGPTVQGKNVFKGLLFRFSTSFPEDRRAEIIEWINQGGGGIVVEQSNKNVQFTIECHGLMPRPADSSQTTIISSQWISGPKYERARESGIDTVTSEWISECIRKDTIVSMDPFRPKDVTAQDREAGLCTTSQYPTQAVSMVFEDYPSQLPSRLQIPRNRQTCTADNSSSKKRARDLEDVTNSDLHSTLVSEDVSQSKEKFTVPNKPGDIGEVSHAVPDVAAAIEDLLAQSNKIQDMETSGRTGTDHSIFSPDRAILGQDRVDSPSTFGISKNWLKRFLLELKFSISSSSNDQECDNILFRTEQKDDLCNSSWQEKGSKQGTTDGFSETQTESQVVGYEEDLSGIQMIIDRVRTRSSLT